MSPHGIHDKVAIIGMGCTRFAEQWDKSADDLLVDAASVRCRLPACRSHR